jgi:HK97 family phage prohead protease
MNKIINQYQTKNATEIKDIDSENRSVAIYLSKFDVIDSDFDVIKRGAFTKSIREHGVDSPSNRKIAFLRHHDWMQQIGKFTRLEEDNVGLFAIGYLGNSTAGNDAWNDYNDGIIREHSIGFRYIADKIKFIEDASTEIGGFYQINELQLWEGSAVTFGANDQTNVVEIMKSENKHEHIIRINDQIETITKSLVNGKGSDERLFEMEMQLKRLNSQLVSLAMHEPVLKHHSLLNEPKNDAVNWNNVIGNIKIV